MNCREPEGAPAEAFIPARLRLLPAAFLLCLLAGADASGVEPGTAAARLALNSLPPCFEANRGQADPRFAFIARGQRHTVHLAPDQLVMDLAPDPAGPARRLRLIFVGANPLAPSDGLEPLAGTVNYFLGHDPARWRTGVPMFGRARFDHVLPGIDILYYSTGRQLEYDFLLAPGADPRAIRLRIEGADDLRLGQEGELILEAGGERILQHRPVAHQTIAGARRAVSARYVLEGREVTIALGRYDTNLPLVIDPVLSYATYLGAFGQQNGWAIAVDTAGAIYVAGETLAALNELPVSGFQTNFAGGTSTSGDAFVAKLNSSGTAYEYLTYLGGASLDGAVGVAVDTLGHAFVTGYTTSRYFPVTPGALQTNIAGQVIDRTTTRPSDAFVTKLSPNGSALIYSTFLGGTNLDSAFSIAVDAAGCAHVAGYTTSEPVYRRTNQVCTTVCTNAACGPTVCKTSVSRAGEFVTYSLVTNVTRTEITTTPPVSNVVYKVVETTLVGLKTLDPGFPTTNAAQPFHGGSRDGFLAKLNPDGTGLIYSTYLGGSDDEVANGVALDPAGNAFVAGYTESSDFSVTTNAFQLFRGDRRDAFVVSLDPAGAPRYSTYLGGAHDDTAFHVAADALGSAYVTGGKSSADFPTTPGAFNRGGVFRSIDGAATWIGAGLGLTHTVIEALARAPGGDLFAATPRGVFRSANDGLTWTVSFASLSVNGVLSLAVDGTGTRLYAGTGKGLFVSTNAGATWMAENGGLGTRTLYAVAHTPTTLFVGTHGAGIFRSTNDAASWKTANAGLGDLTVNAFASHPLEETIVYVATDGGVFRSTNHGVNWRAAHTGMTTKKTQALALDPAAPGTLYAGTTRGVFKSADHGSNWVISGTGLGNSNVLALAIDPLSTATLFAGTTNGLFKSVDAGATWTASSTGLAPRVVKSLIAGPTALYAGLRSSNSFGGSNDVFLTKLLPDGSNLAWSLVLGGTKNDQGYAVAVDATGHAFVAGSSDSTNFPVANPSLFLRATNSGKSDAFLARLTPDGADLLFSMYLGGKSPDYGYGLALDGAGTAYVTGRTQSTNFPTLAAIQPGFGGKSDAFVVKVIPEVGVAVARNAEDVVVRWPGPMPGYALEGADSPAGPWTTVAATPALKNGWSHVTVPAATACRFYRLRRVE